MNKLSTKEEIWNTEHINRSVSIKNGRNENINNFTEVTRNIIQFLSHQKGIKIIICKVDGLRKTEMPINCWCHYELIGSFRI